MGKAAIMLDDVGSFMIPLGSDTVDELSGWLHGEQTQSLVVTLSKSVDAAAPATGPAATPRTAPKAVPMAMCPLQAGGSLPSSRSTRQGRHRQDRHTRLMTQHWVEW